MPATSREAKSSWLMWFVVAAVVTSFIFALAVFWQPPAATETTQPSDGTRTGGPGIMMSSPFMSPGLERPPTLPAAQAKLDDAEQVIGVLANGRPRAYRVLAMSNPTSHVINDVVNHVAVTATYCDRCNFAQVFTNDTPDKPLGINLAGVHGKLVLKYGDAFFSQEDGKPMHPWTDRVLPFTTMSFVLVPWKQWREAHPETDVFVGREVPAHEAK
jgi:hypothetical protein